MEAANLNLRSNETEKLIRERDVNLYSWMKMAPKENIIAKELVEEYRISIKGSEKIKRFFEEFKDINYSIILCYYHILSENLDPLIISKFGKDTAESVSKRAGELIRNPSNDIYQNLRNFQSFDVELIKRGINPGSVADLTISSIYLALMDGLRF
jgi:triphosphoribosyl-dephospho-CoA synthase